MKYESNLYDVIISNQNWSIVRGGATLEQTALLLRASYPCFQSPLPVDQYRGLFNGRVC